MFIEHHVLAGLKVQPWDVVEKMLKHDHRSTHAGLMTSASHAVTFTGAYKPFQVQGREVSIGPTPMALTESERVVFAQMKKTLGLKATSSWV